jgi:carbonic anhydrase
MPTDDLANLFASNRAWSLRRTQDDPHFFERLAHQQSPKYLWIGCSDSRVPANEIVGLDPGELFVHRNIANVVNHTDFNCMSVLQFAVEVLRVEHIIIVGHYRCSGIRCALGGGMQGVADHWLRHIEDVQRRNAAAFHAVDLRHHEDLLCELNVVEQMRNLCRTNIVRDAWKTARSLTVHGWVYGLEDGLLKDIGWSVDAPPVDLDAQQAQLVTQLVTAQR